MDTSKSAKRVAKVAKQSSKAKVRAQRGLLFPVSLAATIILGLFLVVYARQGGDRAAAASEPPTLDDHWHVAYGIRVCGEWKAPLTSQNELVDGVSLGIHSHADGVVHIHPFSSAASGRNAKLGIWMKAAGIDASNDKIELPEGQGTYENGIDECDGKAASWKVGYWADSAQSSAPTIFVTDFSNIRFTQDRGAITLAFVPDDVNMTDLKPPSIPQLDQLTDIGPTTTVAGDPGATTTVAGDTTATTTAGATTTATTSAAATTTVG